jgi:hypothetical protein
VHRHRSCSPCVCRQSFLLRHRSEGEGDLGQGRVFGVGEMKNEHAFDVGVGERHKKIRRFSFF